MPLPAAIPAAGAFLAENPFIAAILANLGTSLLGNLFGQETPYEKAVGQQLGVGQTLIPQLQQAAAGMPTRATEAIQQQVRQQTTAAQQSYAAGATARGGGGTPVAAQQGRFRAAEAQALTQQLGQAQQGALGALTGIYGAGVQGAGMIEMRESQARRDFLGGLMDYLAWYRSNKNDDQAQRLQTVLHSKLGLTPSQRLNQ